MARYVVKKASSPGKTAIVTAPKLEPIDIDIINPTVKIASDLKTEEAYLTYEGKRLVLYTDDCREMALTITVPASDDNTGNGEGEGEGGGDDPSETPSDVPDVCQVTPLEAYQSTNLNSKIHSYNDLTTRMLHMLGWPSVAVSDIHIDQIHEAIAIACEMFTKYAGYTQEIMIFDSRLYKPNVGIHLGKLFTVASIPDTHYTKANWKWLRRGPNQIQKEPADVYVALKEIPKVAYYISEEDYRQILENCKEADKEFICYLRDYSIQNPDGLECFSIVPNDIYKFLIERRGYKVTDFKKCKNKIWTQGGREQNLYLNHEELGPIRDELHYARMYDYDIMDYRKVISVTSFREMTSMSPLSLFAGISGLAEQTYFAWEFNNKGFSLLERHCLGEWMDMRDKILALDRRWNFDKYSQWFTIIPQPHPPVPTTAVIEAYVERPLRDIIKEPWVFKYALAHVKVMIGNIRGKWGDVQMLGGGVISGNRFTQEGLQEIKELEQMLIEKGGYSNATGPVFVIG